jgi:transposase-like protein/IS1 family transposase
VTCHNCQIKAKKNGKDRKGNQRYRCNQCRKTLQPCREKLLGKMRLPEDKALIVLQLLVEGMSIRSIERITGIGKNTVLRLLVFAGERCEELMNRHLRLVKCVDLQFDEIWTYCLMKEKAKTRRKIVSDKIGDAYCFTAIERFSKLIVAYHLGRRTETDTAIFLEKVFAAVDGTQNIIQITTDGFAPYPAAIAYSLGTRSSYAQLIKVYRTPLDPEDQQKYSPSKIKEAIPTPLWGYPNPDRICTSHVERQNLNIRTALRRFTRLSIGFSKKWENLKAALGLYFAYYNFCRIHSSTRCTPAMEAGLTNTICSSRKTQSGIVEFLAAPTSNGRKTVQ